MCWESVLSHHRAGWEPDSWYNRLCKFMLSANFKWSVLVGSQDSFHFKSEGNGVARVFVKPTQEERERKKSYLTICSYELLSRFYKHNYKTSNTQLYIRALLQQTNQACKQNITSKTRETQGNESPHLETFKCMLTINLRLIVSKWFFEHPKMANHHPKHIGWLLIIRNWNVKEILKGKKQTYQI